MSEIGPPLRPASHRPRIRAGGLATRPRASRHLLFEFLREPGVVTVEESDPFPAGFTEAAIARNCRPPGMRSGDPSNTSFTQSCDDVLAIVSRAIVAHKDL